MKRIYWILFLTSLLSACPAWATDYLVRSITLADGLSQSTVSDLTVDSKGFLWAGTRFGLNRCDFSTVRNYYHVPADPTTIPNSRIRGLFCDSKGNLWVAGETGTAYRPEGSGAFIQVTAEDGTPLMSRSFHEEDNGVLIGAQGAVYYHDHASGQNVRLQTRGGSTFPYMSITPWGGYFYVLSTRWDGLFLFDRSKAAIIPMTEIKEKNVTAVGIDHTGNLWVAEHGRGITVYDRSFKPLRHLSTTTGEIGSDIVLDISTHGTDMWLATDGGGINILNGSYERKDTPELRNLGSVSRIYSDPAGNIYAGTVRSGIAAISRTGLTTDFDLPGNPRQLGPVTCIVPWRENNLLVGSDGEGIFVFDTGTSSYRHMAGTRGWKVTDICPYGEGRFLVSTYGNGFRLIEPVSGNSSDAPAFLAEVTKNNIGSGVSHHLRGLPDGRVAIVGRETIIADPGTGTFSTIGMPDKRSYASPFFSNHTRLLLYTENTVMEVNPGKVRAETILTVPKGITILSAAYDEANDRILLGTDSGLMSKTGNGVLLKESNESGLMPERLTSLCLDSRGNLWAGAGSHLVMFGKEGKRTMAFGKYDGVTPNEYLANATLSIGNTTYLGGVNGLLRIDLPGVEETIYAAADLKPVVAEVTVDGLPYMVDEVGRRVEVPSSSASISLTVLDRGPNALRGRIYRFHVDGPGYNKDMTTMERNINLNFLKPGSSYRVSLSCGAPDGSWTEPVELVTLKVDSVWWRSWWFTAMCLVITVAACSIAWLRIRRKRLALAEKERLLARREQLEGQVKFLIATNYALRTPLTMIYAPVKSLLEKIRNGEKVEMEQTLESIYINSKRMRDVIDHNLEPNQEERDMEHVELPDVGGKLHGLPEDVTGKVDLSGLTALVAEEDNSLCLFVATELNRHFGNVVHAFNGNDALLALKQYHPDIVISSVELPGIDGLKLCRTIKTSPDSGHIPVILLTALRRDSTLEKGYGAGADSHLSKPFDMNVLLLRCRNLLHTRRVIRTRYEGDRPVSQGFATTSNADESFMRKINKLIDERMENPDFCVDTVVDAMGMSRTALYSRFKAVAGKSIGTYVTERKVEKAKELLSDHSLPVAEISERLGFTSQRYFSTFFKEKTGQTPTSFRKGATQSTATT